MTGDRCTDHDITFDAARHPDGCPWCKAEAIGQARPGRIERVEAVAVGIRRLPSGKGLIMPAYQSAGASGIDLCASLRNPLGEWAAFATGRTGAGEPQGSDAAYDLAPGGAITLGCGFAFAIPAGLEGQVRGRSGLAAAQRISIEHGVGTVDSDYRGEVRLIIANRGSAPFRIRHGQRIAQLVIAPVARATLIERDNLDITVRGEAGLGSTGA